MKKYILRIATRKSPLAIWQAEFVKQKLLQAHPQLTIELVGLLTTADKFAGIPLSKIGGKGLFVKELENALLENRADIAVHSMKDVPGELPEGLIIDVICKREDPRDVFVALHYQNFAALPSGATIGTSSLRRETQLKGLRPDLTIIPLRGNVGTRLERLRKGEFAAIILAAAGLQRLNATENIRAYFNPEEFLPAIGQGALGIECREADTTTRALIAELDDLPTHRCVTAERSMNAQFGGNCQVPIAAYATITGQTLTVRGMVGKTDGSIILRSTRSGNVDDAEKLGYQLAQDLFAQGAREIINVKQ